MVSELWIDAKANKNFFILIGIFIYTVKQYNKMNDHTNVIKVQAEKCNGRFDKQELVNRYTEKKTVEAVAKSDSAIKTAGESEDKSKYAVKISKKAIETSNKTFKLSKETHKEVEKISDNVNYLNNSWKEFVEGKYGDKEKINN